MRSVLSNSFISIALLVSATASAQDAPATAETRQRIRLPYEVVVTPTVTRTRLRSLIQEVTEDFVARFNELNLDDDYDVQCYTDTPTGSHLRKRLCEPTFFIEARSENSSQYMDDIRNGHTGFLLSSNALLKETHREYETLQEKFDEFTSSDKELRGIGLVLGSLKERLENYGEDD